MSVYVKSYHVFTVHLVCNEVVFLLKTSSEN